MASLSRSRRRLKAPRGALGGCLAIGAAAALACSGDGSGPELGSNDSALRCSPLADECPETVPSYAEVVGPIIEAKCSGCHIPHNPDFSAPWPFNDRLDVQDWTFSIIADLGGCLMPPADSGLFLTVDERIALNDWLICGAPDN